MRLSRATYLFCLLFACSTVAYGRRDIVITTQEQFDNLSRDIKSALSSGEQSIVVTIAKGTFYFKENHVLLRKLEYPDVSVSIRGEGSVLRPVGEWLQNGSAMSKAFDTKDGYLTPDNQHFNFWSIVYTSNGEVEIVDVERKICRLWYLFGFSLDEDELNNSYLHLTESYMGKDYKIKRITPEYLDFYADDLKYYPEYKSYNVNFDIAFGKTSPRFQLCNVRPMNRDFCISPNRLSLSGPTSRVYRCDANNFLYLTMSHFKSFAVSGLTFAGSSDKKVFLLDFYSSSCENGITIRSCSFEGQRSGVLRIISTDDVEFSQNVITNNALQGVYSDNYSSHTSVTSNLFKNNGSLYLGNNICVDCKGTDYYVANNSFVDFGYTGIYVGVHYLHDMEKLSRGIVEKNELYYTERYFNTPELHTMMDAGAIYVGPQNAGAIIRYNYIHDYNGMSMNRGIFCDDGAHDFQIYGNIVMGIKNGNCIDSRRVSSVEKTHNTKSRIDKANVNITIRDNLVDGRILFVGNDAENNGCEFAGNYRVIYDVGTVPGNKIGNVTVSKEGVEVHFEGKQKGRIVLSGKDYKALKQSPEWSYLKQFAKRKISLW